MSSAIAASDSDLRHRHRHRTATKPGENGWSSGNTRPVACELSHERHAADSRRPGSRPVGEIRRSVHCHGSERGKESPLKEASESAGLLFLAPIASAGRFTNAERELNDRSRLSSLSSGISDLSVQTVKLQKTMLRALGQFEPDYQEDKIGKVR